MTQESGRQNLSAAAIVERVLLALAVAGIVAVVITGLL